MFGTFERGLAACNSRAIPSFSSEELRRWKRQNQMAFCESGTNAAHGFVDNRGKKEEFRECSSRSWDKYIDPPPPQLKSEEEKQCSSQQKSEEDNSCPFHFNERSCDKIERLIIPGSTTPADDFSYHSFLIFLKNFALNNMLVIGGVLGSLHVWKRWTLSEEIKEFTVTKKKSKVPFSSHNDQNVVVVRNGSRVYRERFNLAGDGILGKGDDGIDNIPAPVYRFCYEFSPEEVHKHNTAADCWITYKNNVYNVTSFLELHPGGADLVLKAAGGAIDGYFKENEFHKKGKGGCVTMKILEELKIGKLEKPEKNTGKGWLSMFGRNKEEESEEGSVEEDEEEVSVDPCVLANTSKSLNEKLLCRSVSNKAKRELQELILEEKKAGHHL